ncbi:MAG TPA: YbjN domain-containing protein [Candidatus Corynebacterium avicola]|uniref:YbjN domain-containing protein n=1 Tax=Candidatus Corynebacterium avicola TaxID=2838527 RepID=A0A9D1RSZ3_9CORY|nr:YbjN domain-containing protein [Candidatus Corynebacterium avicola]
MFGRLRNKRAAASADSAKASGATAELLTGSAELADELRRALIRVECGHTEVSVDEDSRPVLSLQVEDMDAAVALGRSPLCLVLTADWDGVLEGERCAEVHRSVLNDWNAAHTVPRAVAVLDADGEARVHLDTVMDCSAGATPAQVDEWVRRALAGLSQVTEFLDEEYPDARRVGSPDDDAQEDTEVTEVADTAELVAGEKVTLDRIAAVLPGETVSIKEDGASGRRGNGYVRTVGAAAPDIALHDGTLAVTTGAAFGDTGEVPDDAVAWLHAVCAQVNTEPDGVVSVVTVDEGEIIMTCALHRPVGAGMGEAQLSAVITAAREQVGHRFSGLVAEVTGGVDDA